MAAVSAKKAYSKPPQDVFIREREARWTQLQTLLMGDKGLHKLPPAEIAAAGRLYRIVCADLMRARSAGYGRDLVAYLDSLAADAHSRLYRAEPYRLAAVWELLARDFPAQVRKDWRFLAAATAMFVIPLAISIALTLSSPEFALEVLPKEQLEMLAHAYAEGFDGGRSESQDSAMAGFYVYNNVGIAFRTFATGIFFGLGSVFFLVFNGIMMGATLGYVVNAGSGKNILTFVMGHGAFELTAIVIAGAAGLRMGYAMVRTEGRTRLGSLRASAGGVARLILGAAVMLGIAALIEGYWSPSSVPYIVKWTVAGLLWLGVVAYFIFAGRGWRPKAPPKATEEQAA